MAITTSYIICATQRSGSSLLCEALTNTGVTGNPAEYFLEWEDGVWARSHGITTRHAYLDLVRRHGTTPNGVFGIKLMWNYVAVVHQRLQEYLPTSNPIQHAQLSAIFPNLHYVFLTRRDHVRQAVSWSIAAQTNHYTAWQAADDPAMQAPVFDVAQIDGMVQVIAAAEAGWSQWFVDSGITPFRVVYEDFVDAYESTARQIMDFLAVAYPRDLVVGPRTLQRQATARNDAWVEAYGMITQRVGA